MIEKITKRLMQKLKYIVRKVIKPDIIEIYGIRLNINYPSITDNLREFFIMKVMKDKKLEYWKKF